MPATSDPAQSIGGKVISINGAFRSLISRVQSPACDVRKHGVSVINLSPRIRRHRALPRSGWCRRLVCLAVVVNLLIWPGPNLIIEQLPVFASTTVEYGSGVVHSIEQFLVWLFSRSPKGPVQETLAGRIARVSSIRASPPKSVGYIGETVTFTAVGVDARNEVVHGVKFDWVSSDSRKAQVDEAGRATFLQGGAVRIVCHAGSAQAAALVVIRPTRRPRQSDDEWRTDQNSVQTSSFGAGMSGSFASLLDKIVPTAYETV